MTPSAVPPAPTDRRAARRRSAIIWHAATAAVVLASLVVQVILVIGGTGVLVEGGPVPGVGTRVLRFFSYFTVQSNLLVLVAAVTLAVNPERSGRLWSVLRLASLYGITVTFVIYLLFLRPILDLHGAAAWTDTGLHLVSPAAAVLGYLLFGPFGRIDRATILWSLIWPVVYVVYTLLHGLDRWRWYPYPFIDVPAIGYARALLNGAGILVLLLAVSAGYLWWDRRAARR